MLTVHGSNMLYACHVLCSSCDSEFVSGAHIPIAVDQLFSCEHENDVLA